jgi:hypothetical protein
MAERKTKRQRFSLGGPAVDTSFEDYLTGSNKHVSSDEEEEFDQENLDPRDNFEEEEEEYYGDESEPEPIRQESKRYLINKIHIHQNNTESKTAKDVYYLLQGRLILPNAPLAITRLLRVPAILLFEQLSEALYAAFDWGGDYSKHTLEQATPTERFWQRVSRLRQRNRTYQRSRSELTPTPIQKSLHGLLPGTGFSKSAFDGYLEPDSDLGSQSSENVLHV